MIVYLPFCILRATLSAAILITAVTAADLARAASPEPRVWQNLTQAELDDAYDQAVYAPNLEQVLARQAANSKIARAHLGEPRNFRYGEGDHETLEVYPTGAPHAPIVIFIHGGTWRFGQARDNAFGAENTVQAGAHLVVPNFSSVAETGGDLAPLIAELRRAVGWVHGHASSAWGGDPQTIYLVGFSSGAHLAAVLLTTDWAEVAGLPADVIKRGMVVSGMYELAPVALSSRRNYVKLDAEAVAAFSAQRHLDLVACPLTVVYGTRETPEFQRQAREFFAALQAAGLPATQIVGPEYNHFELIETLGNPFGPVGREVRTWITSAAAP